MKTHCRKQEHPPNAKYPITPPMLLSKDAQTRHDYANMQNYNYKVTAHFESQHADCFSRLELEACCSFPEHVKDGKGCAKGKVH